MTRMKSYRLPERTLRALERLEFHTGENQTKCIIAAIEYLDEISRIWEDSKQEEGFDPTDDYQFTEILRTLRKNL